VPRALLKQMKKWGLRVAKTAGVVVGLVLAFQVLVLPAIVRRAVSRALSGLGLADVTFEVRGASFWQTELARVSVGREGLARVGAIGVDYSPSSLLKGRVQTIWVTGAEIEIGIKDGAIDLGPLALKPPKQTGAELPFDRLELRASTLGLVWEQRRLWVPVRGIFVNEGSGRARVDMVVRVQGGDVQVVGAYDAPGGRLDLTADAQRLDVPSLVAALPQRYASSAPSVSVGTISLKATYSQTSDGTKIRAVGSGTGLRLGANFADHRLWVQDLALGGEAEVDGNLRLLTADVQASAKRMSVDGEAATGVILQARKEAGRLRIDLTAQGADWRLRKLEAAIDGVFDAAAQRTYTAEASIGLDTKIPRQIASQLRLQGIGVRGLGLISVDGQVKARATPAAQGQWTWEASTAQMQAALSPGELAVGKDAVVLRGLSGVLSLVARADAHQATVRIMPGSNMRVGSVLQKAAPMAVHKADDAAPLATLGIDGEAGALTVRFAEGVEPWELTVPAASLKLSEAAVTAGGAKIDGAGATLRFRAKASAKQTEVFALDGCEAHFGSVNMVFGGERTQAGPWKLAIDSRPGEPLLRILPSQGSGVAVVSMRATAEQALALKSSSADVKLSGVGISGTLSLDAGGRGMIKGEVSLAEGSAAYKPLGVRLAGVSAVAPVTWNQASASPGKFSIGSIQVRDASYPPVSGTVGMSERRVDFAANWPFIKDVARIDAQGWVDFGAQEPRGQISATMPTFALKDEKAVAGLVKELKGFDISGTLQGKADVAFHGSEVRPMVSLTMKDVSVASKEYERSVEGVNGTISIDSFRPLRTPGGQRLSVRQATAGKLKFSDGVLVFRIEDTSVFQVEGTDWGWAGGRVYANSFRLDLNKPRIDLVASGDRLELAQVLKMAAEKQMTGEGTLYGRLPVKLTWPQEKKQGQTVTRWSEPGLEFGEGFIYATPGGGHLRVIDPEATVGVMLEKQDPSFAGGGKMEAVRSRLMNALRDLEYSVLKMDFIKEGDGLLARAHMAGKGAGPNGQEIGGLTVNVRGFDGILRNIITVQKELSFGE